MLYGFSEDGCFANLLCLDGKVKPVMTEVGLRALCEHGIPGWVDYEYIRNTLLPCFQYRTKNGQNWVHELRQCEIRINAQLEKWGMRPITIDSEGKICR